MEFLKCPHCNNEIPPGSLFCQSCGRKLSKKEVHIKFLIPQVNIRDIFSRFARLKKYILPIIILLIFIAGTVYAAPKIKDYIQVEQIIKKVEQLKDQNKFDEASGQLLQVENKWTISSRRNAISKLKSELEEFSNYQKIYDKALAQLEENKLEEARDGLKSISIDYPRYEEVKSRLDDAQNKIETKIKEEAKAREEQIRQEAENERKKAASVAAAAKVEAARQAQAAKEATARAEADKTAAQAQARAAEVAQAQANAQAAAQAQAAREAQARADTLRSAQTNAYWDKWKRATAYIVSGHSKVDTAFSYLSDLSTAAALNYLIYALNDYNSAKNVLGNDYIEENQSAHSYLQAAINNFIEYERSLFNAVYYIDSYSFYFNQAESYRNEGNRYIQLARDNLGKY